MKGAQLEDAPDWVQQRVSHVEQEIRDRWGLSADEPLRVIYNPDDPMEEIFCFNHEPGRRMKWSGPGVHIGCTCDDYEETPSISLS